MHAIVPAQVSTQQQCAFVSKKQPAKEHGKHHLSILLSALPAALPFNWHPPDWLHFACVQVHQLAAFVSNSKASKAVGPTVNTRLTYGVGVGRLLCSCVFRLHICAPPCGVLRRKRRRERKCVCVCECECRCVHVYEPVCALYCILTAYFCIWILVWKWLEIECMHPIRRKVYLLKKLC